MCGIVCIIGETTNNIEIDTLLASIKHRGPDYHATYITKKFAAGHCRLAINDLSEYSNQPFVKDNLIVLFNGEIYNTKANGFDKELDFIVAAYKTGRNFQHLLEGQYAIVIIDTQKNCVTMLRDQWGICPLYYGWDSKYRLIISSEKRVQALAQGCKAIELFPNQVKVFALDGKYDSISSDTGRELSINSGLFNEEVAWALLRDSVKSRCSHTEVGYDVALSGGLDSSVLVKMMKDLGLKINAHTVSFVGGDDLWYAAKFAKENNIKHEIWVVSKEQILKDLPKMLYHLEDPIPNEVKFRGYIRNWYVAQFAKSKVIISGEGADELFAGYPQFRGLSSISRGVERQSCIKSMRAINLDRVDRGGMAFGKEYRMPYLGYQFAKYVMSCVVESEKATLKKLAEIVCVPDYIINRPKYGNDEQLFGEIFQVAKGMWNVN